MFPLEARRYSSINSEFLDLDFLADTIAISLNQNPVPNEHCHLIKPLISGSFEDFQRKQSNVSNVSNVSSDVQVEFESKEDPMDAILQSLLEDPMPDKIPLSAPSVNVNGVNVNVNGVDVNGVGVNGVGIEEMGKGKTARKKMQRKRKSSMQDGNRNSMKNLKQFG